MEGMLAKTKNLLHKHLVEAGCSASIKTLDKNIDEAGDLLIQSKTGIGISFDAEHLIAASTAWPLPIAKVTFIAHKAHVWFDRVQAYCRAIALKEWNRPVNTQSDTKIYVEPSSANAYASMSLTEFRANILRKVIGNCYTHAGYAMIENSTNDDAFQKTTVKHIKVVQQKSKLLDVDHVEILCGPVLTGTDLPDAAQYIQQRSNDMQLIAQHRYGLRMHDNLRLQELVASLGRSAAIVDMLHKRQTNAIDMRNPQEVVQTQCSSKGAAFILYNYARFASIFKKHAKLVEEDPLNALPPVEMIDYSLLTESDEWQLLYVYVIGFPGALEQTIGYGPSARVAPYHLLEFTQHLIQCLSKYYSRVRILTANRPKLQPVMFARLHLLRAVHETLKVLLSLLDLEPIEEM